MSSTGGTRFVGPLLLKFRHLRSQVDEEVELVTLKQSKTQSQAKTQTQYHNQTRIGNGTNLIIGFLPIANVVV